MNYVVSNNIDGDLPSVTLTTFTQSHTNKKTNKKFYIFLA